MNKSLLLLLAIFSISTANISAQEAKVNPYGKGIVFSPEDGSYEVKLGARFQTLYTGTYDLDTEEYSDQLLTRRARLKFDGFVYSPKIKYKIELALSNRDTRNSSSAGLPQNSATANIVLDAVAKYEFAENWEVWFGQTKLPGNRERVISSQKLQFVDRSLVNSRFNIDRDLGVHLLYSSNVGGGVINTHVALAMGEGRNITSGNEGGYDYSGRVEYLPFGKFTNKGDYFGSDLEREETPKLSVGVSFDYNDGATRSRGQLGGFVRDLNGDLVSNDLTSVFVDAMFKSNGFSFASEYAYKDGDNNVTGFGTGSGFVAQAGYLFMNNIEPALRFTTIDPDDVSSLAKRNEYTFGLSKYVVGHNLKIQTDVSYTDFDARSNEILYRFQVEVAF
ncbi:porin [Balneola sp. MJW-20]|uniref:porin n=1 Tax=Gracilimonas aurantiaca TaxID=3234185 RepID=UPI00346780DD